MSDNAAHETTAPEAAPEAEQQQLADPAPETEHADSNGKEAPAHDVEKTGNGEAVEAAPAANGDTSSKSEEEGVEAEATVEDSAAANSRKRKASDSTGAPATDATEEKRPTTEAAAPATEDSGVHPDADMPLPSGDGPAAIKTKTVEDVQASSEATV